MGNGAAEEKRGMRVKKIKARRRNEQYSRSSIAERIDFRERPCCIVRSGTESVYGADNRQMAPDTEQLTYIFAGKSYIILGSKTCIVGSP